MTRAAAMFSEKVVLVTAGASGLGLAIARRFVAQGARACVVDRDAGALAAIEAEGLDAIRADARSEADMAGAAQALQAKHAGLDVLVNNAGGFVPRAFDALDAASWRDAIGLNLDPVFVATKAFAPLLRSGGCIVNVSSSLARIAEPAAPAYCAAKAGVEALTRCLALDFAPRGIRVVAVAPGPIGVGDGEKCVGAGDFDYRRFNPCGRYARAEEVAALVCFVASEQAGYMTGNVVDLDGGESALPVAWSALRRLVDGGRL